MIAGHHEGGRRQARLTDIQQHGLITDYDDASEKDGARHQLLERTLGLRGHAADISDGGEEGATARPKATRTGRSSAWWIAGVTANEILPVDELGDEAVYLRDADAAA